MKRINRKQRNAVRILSSLAVAFVIVSAVTIFLGVKDSVSLSPEVGFGPGIEKKSVTPFITLFVSSLIILFFMVAIIIYYIVNVS